jgi:hypothetical protein
VVGQNQSVCRKGPTRGSIRLAVLVGKNPVMIKELVEINQYEMDEDSELETVKLWKEHVGIGGAAGSKRKKNPKITCKEFCKPVVSIRVCEVYPKA